MYYIFICLFQHLIELSEDDPLPSEDEELNVGDVERNDDDFGMETENDCKHFNITMNNVQTIMLLICTEPPSL